MEQLFLNWFLVFVRAGAMLSIFPLFSASAVPVRLRIALAGFISLLVMPTLGAPPVDPKEGNEPQNNAGAATCC